MKSEWGKQMNPTSLWHPYWLNLPHDWFCRLGCSKRTKANQKWKLFCVSYSLFSWVRRLEIGKCHLLICWGGNSWPLHDSLLKYTLPKAPQRPMGWYVLPINNNIPVTIFYQHQHQAWVCWGVTCQRESIRISLVTLTNSSWETIISPNRNCIHSGYLAFGDSDYPCTFYLYQHFPHLFIINISLRICLPC